MSVSQHMKSKKKIIFTKATNTRITFRENVFCGKINRSCECSNVLLKRAASTEHVGEGKI